MERNGSRLIFSACRSLCALAWTGLHVEKRKTRWETNGIRKERQGGGRSDSTWRIYLCTSEARIRNWFPSVHFSPKETIPTQHHSLQHDGLDRSVLVLQAELSRRVRAKYACLFTQGDVTFFQDLPETNCCNTTKTRIWW